MSISRQVCHRRCLDMYFVKRAMNLHQNYELNFEKIKWIQSFFTTTSRTDMTPTHIDCRHLRLVSSFSSLSLSFEGVHFLYNSISSLRSTNQQTQMSFVSVQKAPCYACVSLNNVIFVLYSWPKATCFICFYIDRDKENTPKSVAFYWNLIHILELRINTLHINKG